MSDLKTIGLPPQGDRRRATPSGPGQLRSGAEGWEAYTKWLNRVQGEAAGTAAGGRHAAITRNLNSWSHYKSWAEKVRGTWERDK